MTIASGPPSANIDPAFFLWVAVLVGVVIAGGILVAVIRRRFRAGGQAELQGFTLHEIREMHRRGDLTDEEFEQARATILRQVGATPSPPKATGDETGPAPQDPSDQ